MVGTPFHWHGRVPGPNGGIDCSGLIIKAAAVADIHFSFKGKYTRVDQGKVIEEALCEHCVKLLPCTPLQAGDILYVPVKDGPGHLLIYTEVGTIIHASDSPMYQKVVEQPYGADEQAMVTASFRLTEAF